MFSMFFDSNLIEKLILTTKSKKVQNKKINPKLIKYI